MFHLKRPSAALVIACVALFLGLGSGAYAATSLIGHDQLAPNSVWHNDLGNGSVHMDNLTKFVQQALDKTGTPGPQGAQGPQGPAGATGARGPAGTDGTNGTSSQSGTPTPVGAGLPGAFYSTQTYKEDVGAGAIATVACDPNDPTNSQKYVAISGGTQDTPDDTTDQTANTGQLTVAASFPGRESFTTDAGGGVHATRKPGRLDGWVVQFGHTGDDPTGVVVYALCVPLDDLGGSLPVHAN